MSPRTNGVTKAGNVDLIAGEAPSVVPIASRDVAGDAALCALIERWRAEQGLPRYVEDEATIRTVATLLFPPDS